MSRKISTFAAFFFAFIYIFIPIKPLAAPAPDITADSALVINLDSDHMLYGKNPDKRISPGAMTALMTAVVALEKLPPDQLVTVKDGVRTGLKTVSAANLKRGEVFSAEDIIYCLLVGSSGEAANALAEHISGNIDDFTKLMNDRAAELGAENTHFANPTGEYDKSAYTTAKDIALLIKHALELPDFLNISSKTYHRTKAVDTTPFRDLYSTNYILIKSMTKYYYRYAVGLFNAYDNISGYSLITLDTHTGARILCVVMGCERYTKDGTAFIGSFTDAKALLSWSGTNFKNTRLIGMSEPVTQIPVLLSDKHSSIALNTMAPLSAVIDIDYDTEKLRREFDLPDKLLAPVEKGQVVGTMSLWYDDVLLGNVELYAACDVKVNMLQYYTYHINMFLTNIWIRIASSVIIVLFIVFVIATIRINKNKRKGKSQRARLRF